jgi:hypothetical protein
MDPLFQFHKLNPQGQAKATAIGEAYSALLTEVTALVGGATANELETVRTKLQEACFFTKRAMAINPENQAQD